MTERKFFVVRLNLGRESYVFEHDDISPRYSKSDKSSILYRAEMPPTDTTSLDDAIAAYKRGVRMKPMPKGPAPVPPKTENSVRTRYLKKLRSIPQDYIP